MSECKCILTEEPNSSSFQTKTILLEPDQEVKVGRSLKECPSTISNGIFDSRVLSKEHGHLVYRDGVFYIKDLGSSNGTFVNNVRISKGGEYSSEIRIFSSDTVRFGAQAVDKERKENEKSVICRLSLVHPSGEEERSRSDQERLEELADKPKRKKKRVKFDDNDNEETMEKVDVRNELDGYRETIDNLEKKLKRKGNEVKNMSENLDALRVKEEILRRENSDLEVKLLAVKASNIEYEMEMAKSKEENQALADQLAVKAKEEMMNIRVVDLESELGEAKRLAEKTTEDNWILAEKLKAEIESSSRKDEEIAEYKVKVDQLGGSASDLTSLQKEVEAGARIIEEQQQEIEGLNNLVSRADDIVKEKESEVAWLNDMLDKHSQKLKERDDDFMNLKLCMTEENETVHQIEGEMMRLIQVVEEEKHNSGIKDDIIAGYNDEVKNLKEKLQTAKTEQESFRKTTDTNLDFAMKQKNGEIDNMKAEIDRLSATVESNQNKLEEQRVTIQQKGKEIDMLKKEIKDLGNLNAKNESTIENLISENNKIRNEPVPEETVSYQTLQERLVREQAQTKELEDEIIQLRLNQKSPSDSGNQDKVDSKKDQDENLLKLLQQRENEIVHLQNVIQQEQQIVNHIQITQEREILQKERQIENLRNLLEGKIPRDIVEKVQAMSLLPSSNGPVMTANQGDEDDEDEDTLSFHDAVSDEEDVICEEPDSDIEDQRYRVTDIADMSLG